MIRGRHRMIDVIDDDQRAPTQKKIIIENLVSDQRWSRAPDIKKQENEDADGLLASLFKSWVRIRAISPFLCFLVLKFNWFGFVIEISQIVIVIYESEGLFWKCFTRKGAKRRKGRQFEGLGRFVVVPGAFLAFPGTNIPLVRGVFRFLAPFLSMQSARAEPREDDFCMSNASSSSSISGRTSMTSSSSV